jgi:hypothetical protein
MCVNMIFTSTFEFWFTNNIRSVKSRGLQQAAHISDGGEIWNQECSAG